MQRIGRVLHISSNRNIILKAENLPQIGERVFDESRRTVGKIFDIFGPFSSPYIAVKPRSIETPCFIGRVLYVART